MTITPNDVWSIVSIVVIIGGVLAFVLTASLRRMISKTQEDAIESLRGRVEDLEGEKKACAEKNDQLEHRVLSLERENEMLKNMVSGTSAIKELALTIQEDHEKFDRSLNELKQIVRGRR